MNDEKHSSLLSYFSTLILCLIFHNLTSACTQSKSSFDVINGKKADASEKVRLHTVRIHIKKRPNGSKNPVVKLCTGSLISESHVLTAAHCLREAESVTVLFEPNAWTQNQKVHTVMPDQFLIHPAYDTLKHTNDVALIKLPKQAPQGFVPVQIGNALQVRVGQSVIIAGYGETKENDNPSTRTLHSAQNTIAKLSGLDNTAAPAPSPLIQIDTGERSELPNSCYGDSGGPLYVEDQRGDLFIIGITSHGDKDCRKGSVYMSVVSYWSWIKATTNQLTPQVANSSIMTNFTSDEQSVASLALCPRQTLMSGLGCNGRYCDDIAAVCAGNYEKVDNSTKWNDLFSEEDSFNAERMLCPHDQFMTGMRCSGRYCDNIAIQCSQFHRLRKSSCHWGDWFSEEQKQLSLPLGRYAAGLECEGSYCDNKRVYTCQSNEVWTPFNSEENGESPLSVCPSGRYANGFACKGRYCDQIALRCERFSHSAPSSQDINWTAFISEEDAGTEMCPEGQIISAIKCKGSYCDEISLGCRKASQLNKAGCYWTSQFSEEAGGRLDLPENHGAVGLRCDGRYCDQKRLWVCPLINEI